MLPKRIKTSDGSVFLSMEVPHLGRIFIRYISSKTPGSRIISRKVYLRVGRTVLTIASTLRSRLIPMLRNILTSYLACLRFISTVRFAPSSRVLEDRLSVVISTSKMNLSTSLKVLQFLQSSHLPRLIQHLAQFHCSRVLRIEYSPRLRHLTESLILCELHYMDLLEKASAA